MIKFEQDDDEWREEPISIAELETPSLILDLDVVERNLRRMAIRMRKLGVKMRPHFKTHKSLEVATIQTELWATGLTVSTLGEASAIAGHGFDDLTWAYPLILNRLSVVRYLMREATLRLVVDSPEAIAALEEGFSQWDGDRVHVWLKVDCGYHRAGVDPRSERALELARRIRDARPLVFDGILSHSGHAYAARSRDELRRVADQERRVMVECAERLRAADVEVPGVSIGSTPAMSVVEDLEGVTEVRPGNYVFYDLTQVELGACAVADCALTVLTSVVSSQPGASHSVIDAGALSLSKDPGLPWVEPPSFGRVYIDYERAELDPELRVTSLSQEHGIVNRALGVGERLRVLPNHSCLVVPNFRSYAVVRGDTQVDMGPIRRGGRDLDDWF